MARRSVALALASTLVALLAAGTRVDAQSADRFASLDEAVAAGRVDAAVVAELRSHGRAKAILRIDEGLNQAALADAVAVAGQRQPAPAAPGAVVGSTGERITVDGGPLPDRVTLNHELNVARTAAIVAAGSGIHETQRFVALPLSAVDVTSEAGLLRLANAPETGFIGLDEKLTANLTETLPFIGQPAAAAAGLTGAGTVVGVLDTGVDYTRAAFGSCTSPGVPAATCRVGWAQDNAPDDGQLDDPGSMHGTNVSGIVAGVAPGAKLAVSDVFNGSSASSSDIAAAISWLVSLKQASINVVAVNLSLGGTVHYLGTCSDLYGFSTALAYGIQPVVASGNGATVSGSFSDGISSPACVSGAISVGRVYDASNGGWIWGSAPNQCTDTTSAPDKVVCSSQTSPSLSMLAPGSFVTAAGITQSGTSQASPHVAGAFAVFTAARPGSSAAAVLSMLQCTGVPVTDPRTGRVTPRLSLEPLAIDNRANATFFGLPPSLVFSLCTATAEPGEPAHEGVAAARSIWHRMSVSLRTIVTVSHAAGIRVAFYRAGTNVPATAISCGSGCSKFSLDVGIYDMAVDGDAAAVGRSQTLTFGYTVFGLGADARSNALTMTTSDSNVGATVEAGEPNPSNAGINATVWYRVTPPTTGKLSLALSGATAPMRVAVYDAGGSTPRAVSTAGTNVVAGPFLANSGTTYDVQVSSTTAATSSFALGWSSAAGTTNANDTASNALVLTGSSGTQTLDNAGAATESGIEKDVWVTWTAPAAGVAAFSTRGSTLDTAVQLYRGPNAASLTLLQSAGDENGSDVGFSGVAAQVLAGDTLWLSIGSANGVTEGQIQVNWDLKLRTAAASGSAPTTPRIGADAATGPGTARTAAVAAPPQP